MPRWAWMVVGVAAGVGALFLLQFWLPIDDYLKAFLLWTQEVGFPGALVLGLVYVVGALVLFPGSVLSMGAGFLFGLLWGTVLVSVASTTAACLAFLMGRSIGRGWIADKIRGNPRFRAVDQAVGRQGFKIVFLIRLSPLFPYTVQNYAFGLTDIKFWKYALASWIGMIPGTIMYVYFGYAAKSIAQIIAGRATMSTPQKVFLWVGLALTVAVVLFVTRLARDAIRDAVGEVESGEATHHEDTAGHRRSPRRALPELEKPELEPMDQHNQELLEAVGPPGWRNREPDGRYNLAVIGGGTAGLVSAVGAAGLGAKVALIERHMLGGDCLNVGCVPSKCIIRSARACADVRRAGQYGIRVPDNVEVDFAAVMERMRRLRARVARHDSAARFRDMGVDVYLGEGRFVAHDAVEVGGRRLRFARAIIATGSRARRPDIEGIEEAGYYTNETIFNLTERPERLAVVGGGPLGCELAQAFQRLGSRVVIVERAPQFLRREDRDAADILAEAFRRDGISVRLNTTVARVEVSAGEKVLHLNTGDGEETVTVDEILVGLGRQPTLAGLDLDAGGIRYDPRQGVWVDDHLRTSNRRVYAAGDVCLRYKFTHTADMTARLALQNALFWGRKKKSVLTIPWCTYTDPEIAHVGMYEKDAGARGIEVDTFSVDMSEVDRAVTDGETRGFLKVHVRKGTDRILGATLVARHAGEMISEVTTAIVGEVGLTTMANVIHPYPTRAEIIRKAADACNRTRLTPALQRWLKRLMAWRR